jgi:hypothetical protein
MIWYLLDLILQASKPILHRQVHDVVEAAEPLTLPFPFDVILSKKQ